MYVADLLKTLEPRPKLTAKDFNDAIKHGQVRGPVIQKDATRFLALRTKLQGVSTQQTDAIKQTSKMLSLGGASKKHWPHLDPNLVACQLMIRILDPLKFAQEGFNLCGPAALASLLTRSRPLVVANFAYSLLSSGRGEIEGNTLRPHKSIRNYDPTSIRQCDWLVMAALRDKKMLNNEKNGKYGLAGATDMKKWLKNAGYATVCAVPTKNAVAGGKSYPKITSSFSVNYHPRKPNFVKLDKKDAFDPENNLRLLKEFYDRDCTIFLITSEKRASGGISSKRRTERSKDAMLHDPMIPNDAIDAMVKNQEKQAKFAAEMAAKTKAKVGTGADEPDHWVLLESMEVNFQEKARLFAFTIFTFGTSVKIGPIDLDEFLTDYGGFVAADSRKVDAVEKKLH